MEIPSKAMVSNSEMIRNFKGCRDKAELFGRLFVLKNNQLDSVLFSIGEYEKISVLLEYMDHMKEKEFIKMLESLPDQTKHKTYTIDYFKNDEQMVISIGEVV